MNLILIPFIIMSVLILLTIYKILTVDKAMQAVYWLILMLVGVSVIFLLANSEILFGYQLVIYSGGIAVLMLFAGMLTEQDEVFIDSNIFGFFKASKTQIAIFAVFALDIIFLALPSVKSLGSAGSLGNTELTYSDSFAQTTGFASFIWETWGDIILLLGLLLLTAILGSVKLAIREEDLEELSDEYIARHKLEVDISTLPGMEDMEDDDE